VGYMFRLSYVAAIRCGSLMRLNPSFVAIGRCAFWRCTTRSRRACAADGEHDVDDVIG
jgi:hypothetical protein